MPKDQSPEISFEDYLSEGLDAVDRYLADYGVKLKSRSLYAAINFVEAFIIKVKTEDLGEFEPGNTDEYVATDWFKVIYARTCAWYKDRYGEAMDDNRAPKVRGIVSILNTPFIIDVPMITIEPGDPGKSVWMCYHDRVRDSENALSWIPMGPNISKLPRADGLKARRLAKEIASNLRCAYIKLMPIDISNRRVAELRDSVIPHLEQSAEQIARNGVEDFKRALWDIQMACELVLKLLAQQRSGEFKETHDLFVLYDRLPAGRVPFPRPWLSRIPNWETITEWRYGGGRTIALEEAFRVYRAALEIVAGAASVASRRLDFSQAKFKIGKAPWLHDDLKLFEPKA